MSVRSDIQKIFAKIAALRTLNEGYPRFNLLDSFVSINNNTNSMEFLIDLTKSLLGVERMKDILINILIDELPTIGRSLSNELINLMNCDFTFDNNSGIPQVLIDGVDINIDGIDFFNLFEIDPLSSAGPLLYDDNTSGLNSIDANTFLFETLQNEGVYQNWGSQTTLNDIFLIKYNGDNTINVKVSDYYANNKTLTELNNDYINSITLLSSNRIINNLIDSLFGSVSNTKSSDLIRNENEINTIIDRLLNFEDDIIDDSYFTFDTEAIRVLDKETNDRSNGVRELFDCGSYVSQINLDTMVKTNSAIIESTSLVEQKEVLSNGLDDFTNDVTSNSNIEDKNNVKLDFFTILTKYLPRAIVNNTLSPKMNLLFAINSKALGGTSSNNGIAFIKANRTLFKGIGDKIKDEVLRVLTNLILREINKLVNKQTSEREIESANNRTLTILSLTGVNQETLRIIGGLS